MAKICSNSTCRRREEREEAVFCPECGSPLEPEKAPQPAPAPATGSGNVKWWAITTVFLIIITALLTYILTRPERQPITAVPQAVPTSSLGQHAEASGPAEPASAEPYVYKPYTNCQVGDIFTYGSYPQGQNGEVEPIEWRVLVRESDRLLVIAEYGLDCKPYNEEWVDTNWSKCTLRTWLNGEFINKAFSAEEQRSLMKVRLSNPNSHRDSSVSGGPDTDDKVFLLSFDEAAKYFSGDADRCCKATAYAVKRGAWVSEPDTYAGNYWWWLRSPGSSATYAAGVGSDGSFSGLNVNSVNGALRPAAFMAL